VFCDAAVMRFGEGVQTPDWVRNWAATRDAECYTPWGFGTWAVTRHTDGAVLGYCGLVLFPDLDGRAEVEIGYRLAREHWGQGYATEAALAVRDFARERLALTRLVALIDPGNIASVAVARKLGMHHERNVMMPGYTHPDQLWVTD
jgi:[ribosomal protein S5]-alanine N-acetyltransferase